MNPVAAGTSQRGLPKAQQQGARPRNAHVQTELSQSLSTAVTSVNWKKPKKAKRLSWYID